MEMIDRVRRNHAIEHATVAALIEKGVRPPMGGYSVAKGFIIWSRASEDAVAAASQEALRLLKSGHSELAISPYCGTNLVTSVLVGGLAAALASGGRRGIWPSLRGSMAALIAMSTLGRPVGRLVQRRFTTLSEVNRVEVATVRTILKRPVTVVWVGTNQDDGF